MQTIGERLEEARKKKGISIREAAEATKIRGDYLQKFESNQFDIGLTEIYTRGFLRNYSNFLKVPADRVLNDYAALGRGEVRPRQPNREVYGRMEISVAKAGESSERAAPPTEGGAAPAPTGAPQPQPRYPRGSNPSLPSGPDPAVVFKYVKIGGGVVLAILAIFLLKALFSGSSTPAPATAVNNPVGSGGASGVPAGALTYKLTALDAVHVRVATRPNSNSPADGDDVFSGLLLKGQTRTIVLEGPQNIHASAGQNLVMEWRGRTIPMTFTGAGSVPIDIPASAR